MKMSLQCDAPDCGHVKSVPEITADLIGKPCPKCGANLLTQEDYAAGQEYFGLIHLLEKLGLASDDAPASSSLAMRINPHAGDLNIKISKRGEE